MHSFVRESQTKSTKVGAPLFGIHSQSEQRERDLLYINNQEQGGRLQVRNTNRKFKAYLKNIAEISDCETRVTINSPKRTVYYIIDKVGVLYLYVIIICVLR